MRAVVQVGYGGPAQLELREIGQPELGPDDVLIRVEAAGLNPWDAYTMRGPLLVRPFIGLRRPKSSVKGTEVAGVVESVGPDVGDLVPGDRVWGGAAGSFAELARARSTKVVAKPDRLTFEQAAALPVGGVTALQGLKAASLRAGEHVAITGATGGVGHFAVQIAKAWGAEVTGTCRGGNEELLRSLGADHVVVYNDDDYLRHGPYDVILENVGGRPLRSVLRALAPGGRAVPNTGRDLSLAAASFVVSKLREDVRPFRSRFELDSLLALNELVDAEQLTPVIDRTYPLAEAGEALVYLEGRHPRGRVVISPVK